MTSRLAFLIGILAIAACSPRASLPPPSGFMSDYTRLSPSITVENAFTYVDKSQKFQHYKMVMIDTVEAFPSEEAKKRGVRLTEMKKLAAHLENALRSTFEGSYPIVQEPSFGVLRMRVAITDVHEGNPLLNMSGVTTATGFGLGTATIEAEFIDARTGVTVAQFLGTSESKRYRPLLNASKNAASEDIVQEWAMMVKDHLDETRGLLPDTAFRTSGSAFR